MKATHWKNMKQWEFENELIRSISNENDISKRKCHENYVDEKGNDQVALLWLYYNANGHIGTWQKGNCWVFKTNF